MNLENIIKRASVALKNSNITTHELDAEIILSDILGVKRESLITNNKIKVSQKLIEEYSNAIKRRTKNEPVAYIVGTKEFWSEDFIVNSSTLIPRPESEILIYKVVNYFKNKKINILDIGTGSGCLLLSVLKELHLSKGTGIDISSSAIKIAKLNAKKLNLYNRTKFKVFDMSNLNSGKYDLVVSNPPYIAQGDIKYLSKDIVNFEPLVALKGGFDGLDLIKKVIYKSVVLLKKNGLLAIEIGNQQHFKVGKILKSSGFRQINKECDYNKNVRCIISTKM